MTTRVLDALDSVPGRRALLIAAALAVLVFAVLAARWRPLWYDELFTLYVASEPTARDTIRALLAGADTNPPIDYLLRHASLAVLGPSPEAFRWPSAVAFVAGLFAIYGFVRRRAPFFASAAAFLLPISTAAVFFAYEGRAYALLFASAPLALWAWQRAVDRPAAPLRLATLLAALCLGPYSHYYGVLNFVPVAAGEAWRCYERRRVDWSIVATIAAACLATTGLLVFARAALAMKGAFWASGFKAGDLLDYYSGFLGYGGALVAVLLGVAVLLAWLGRRRSPRREPPAIPTHEVVAACVLALTPFSAFALAELVTGALTTKYTIALVPGVAIIAGFLLAPAETWMRGPVAVVAAVLAAFGIGHHAFSALSYRGIDPVPRELSRFLQDSSLAIAFDSPQQYLEFVHYEPRQMSGRLFYALDPVTALGVRSFNNDEIALRGLRRIRPLNVVGYHEFIEQHREFIVVYTTAFWPGLVKALRRDGYCLLPVARFDATTVLRAFPGCRPDPA
ncbi:MAG TPA: glycosyltransferase family 39 protein [Steroidobacteraceae bacterium]